MLPRFAIPLVMAALVASLSAQSMQEEVKGRILPAKGESRLPESVMITLRSERGSFVETHPVDTNGNFSFVNVPPGGGDYMLIVTSPNRRTVTHSFGLLPGTTSASGITPFITVDLGALLTQDKPDTESGRTLSANWLSLPEAVREELMAADDASLEGDHQRAIRHLEKALAIQPLYFAYNNLAVEYLAVGDEERAIEALEKSIQLEPRLMATHRNLGVIHLDAGRGERSVQHFRDGLDVDDSDFQSWMLLGEAQYGLGELAPATQAFERAVQLDSDSAEARLNLGQCYFRQGRAADAVAEFRGFLERGGQQDERAAQVLALIARLETRAEASPPR